jgi:alkylation response protein AidB-like acyl-CoA dehydrogenase
VNGQKVWNTYGMLASFCELLVRTDPTASKHRGITCLLVDMTLPGIEVRPTRTLTGEREFCELIFTDVFVPDDAILGAEHDGWTVAMATLSFERGGVASLHLQLRARIRRLVETARENGTGADPLVRQRLADLYTRGETLRFLADRAVSRAAAGLPPGPESSLIKIVWSQVGRALPLAAADVVGSDVLAWDAVTSGRAATELLSSTSLTIAGGTTEVNRNVVAERVLGLPKEPRG